VPTPVPTVSQCLPNAPGSLFDDGILCYDYTAGTKEINVSNQEAFSKYDSIQITGGGNTEQHIVVGFGSLILNTPLVHSYVGISTTVKRIAATVGAHGDPHIENIRGERFDIKRAGWHRLIQLPRVVSSKQTAQFRVDADIEPRLDICGEMYIRRLEFSGNLLPELDFTFGGGLLRGELLVNGTPVVEAHIPGLIVSSHGKSAEVHAGGIVSYLTAARVGCCYPYLNYKISLAQSSFQNPLDVGGLLGQDAHSEVSSRPQHCDVESLKFGTIKSHKPILQSDIGINI